jgi:dipicolinate synthase subunit A
MRWAVVAGDRRETEAAACLRRQGHEAVRAGGPGEPAAACLQALAAADAVLGPVLGTNPAGDALYRGGLQGPLPIGPAWIAACRPGCLWLIGRCGPWLRAALAARGLRLQTYAERDEFATLNAVPTAEGAIARACRLAGRTAWRSRALVVGGGRCALALIARLCALGAEVAAAARDPGERAAAAGLGARAEGLEALPRLARGRDFLFNTVPAPVVAGGVLAALPGHAVVVDLASAPGGTDFEAARRLGLRACLLPGLPGRLYPATAGRILAEVAAALAGADGGIGHGAV